MSEKNSIFKLFKNRTETFDCPFCKKTVKRLPLFNSKNAYERLKEMQNKMEDQTAASLPVDAPAPSKANKKADVEEIFRLFSTYKDPAIDNMLHWCFSLNLADEKFKPQIEAACRQYYLHMNRLEDLGKDFAGIVNDCWFFFFKEACALTKKHSLSVDYDPEKRVYQLNLSVGRGAKNKSCLVTMLHPVCPHCNRQLPECVSELTDKALLVDLVGDTSTGKTVWQVALAAFLKKKGGKYRISDEYELIYLEEANPQLRNRVDRFLEGNLPSQTPREQTVSGRILSGDYNSFGYDAWNSQPSAATAGTEALQLLLVLKKYNRSGNVVAVRFLSLGDNPGENKAAGELGVSNSDSVRYCNAILFFADICDTNGIRSVVDYMEKPYNTGLPYFGFLIPKADQGPFINELHNSLYLQFIKGFVRVLRFNICSTQENGAAEGLARKFAENYLHYSPEELCGAVCYYSRERLENSILTGNAADSVDALYADIVNHAQFVRAFSPRQYGEWLRELLTVSQTQTQAKLFYADDPNPTAQQTVRARDDTRRLLTSYFLRNIFCRYNLDFKRAEELSSDIGFYPVSSLGKGYNAQKDGMHFNIEDWRPYNLFDPVLGFLNSIY